MKQSITIIADSGATKVDWRLITGSGEVKCLSSAGLSPVYMSEDEIFSEIKEHISPSVEGPVKEIYFYGAGVVGSDSINKLTRCFNRLFSGAAVFVESDMLAAARALCGRQSGIVCILGTGSNSCFYDGESIVRNVKAGGFILGDEASGAYFGKRLISDFIKGLLPDNIESEFKKRYNLDYPSIVQKVYKEEQPSRFLASFAPFILEFKDDPHINGIIRSGFEEFLNRNAAQYEYRLYKVNFTGSIAYHFRDILETAVQNCNMKMGTVIPSPIEGLVAFHQQSKDNNPADSALEKSVRAIMAETGIKEFSKAKALLIKYGSVKKAVENY